jgi:hypothetical protein
MLSHERAVRMRRLLKHPDRHRRGHVVLANSSWELGSAGLIKSEPDRGRC